LNTSRKGNAAERFVSKNLEGKGFLVASRRHVGGAGDLIAVHPGGEVLLVEVKATKERFAGFKPQDREAMRKTLLPLASARYLAHVTGSGQNLSIDYVHERDWP
jgi:Holliday junction resolvase-like predicted endonuclease